MLWLDAKRCESYAEPEAGKWTASWRGYVCLLRRGSALLRVAEQLAEDRTKRPRLFSQGSLPVRMPWEIVQSGSEAPKMVQRRYRGVHLLRAERCCEMRSARLAKSQHAGLARSEQVWLLRLGPLLCGVAAQRAEGKTRKPDLSSRA